MKSATKAREKCKVFYFFQRVISSGKGSRERDEKEIRPVWSKDLAAWALGAVGKGGKGDLF